MRRDTREPNSGLHTFAAANTTAATMAATTPATTTANMCGVSRLHARGGYAVCARQALQSSSKRCGRVTRRHVLNAMPMGKGTLSKRCTGKTWSIGARLKGSADPMPVAATRAKVKTGSNGHFWHWRLAISTQLTTAQSLRVLFFRRQLFPAVGRFERHGPCCSCPKVFSTPVVDVSCSTTF